MLSMKVTPTSLSEVLMLEPRCFEDSRGFFIETFKEDAYLDAGIAGPFVQDNLSRSGKSVLRGLHFQGRQGKLVTVVRGEVFDVAVDIRPDSEGFGRWVGTELSDRNHRQLYIPPGFAHGFCVLSEEADVWYKTTDVYRPDEEGGILWSDPDIAVEWPITDPVLSSKDRDNPRLSEIDQSLLPSTQ